MIGSVLDAIHAHAIAEYPREACGLVVVARGKERYIRCRNMAEKPCHHFVLSAQDFAAAEDAGEIVALVHSHPDDPARPSEADRVECEASGVPWLIISVRKDGGEPYIAERAQIEPSGYQAPLVGRQFHHGVLDCWTLCRDWYARECGLTLPNPERRDKWWDDGHSDLYMSNLADAGFTVLPDGADLRRGDLILMQVQSRNGVPNHAGVYIGDGLMLHHMYRRLSSRDVYGGYWREVTRCIARHVSLAK